MSTEDLEAQLTAASTPEKRHDIAIAAVTEPLREAKRRAQVVADHEQARGDDQHPTLPEAAAKTLSDIDPILGMWVRH
jgi:hypothetical protein